MQSMPIDKKSFVSWYKLNKKSPRLIRYIFYTFNF